MQFYASPQVKDLAIASAKENPEVLRVNLNKLREDEYFRRLMNTVNLELSPFKDTDRSDSAFMREMLDLYRTTEDFKVSTSDRQIEREDLTVHAYLKQMEMGRDHPDSQTLQALQRGELKKDDEVVRNYLIKRLQNIPKAM